MKVLLIIDMQNVSFTKETPRYKAKLVIKNINKIAARFRSQGDRVIHIQHNGVAENFCLPQTKEWEIIEGIELNPTDIFINKTANDCFYKSDLENTLNKLGAKEIALTGCATDYCVDTTIRSAFSKDFRITVISDGHTTADKSYLKAREIITHHNFIWSDMTPINGIQIQVMTCVEYLNQTKNMI